MAVASEQAVASAPTVASAPAVASAPTVASAPAVASASTVASAPTVASALTAASKAPVETTPAGVAAASLSPDPALSLDRAQRLLRVLAEPIRLRVVEALRDGERCVCDLTSDLDLAQSKLSFHLRVMKEAGLISARQEGRWIYYRLEPSALLLLRDWLGQLAAGCQTPAPLCS